MSNGDLSKTRLGRMHDVMTAYVDRGELPGLITLVSRRGEVHIDVIGDKAFDAKAAMQRDTIFRISSMTKPITALATLILIEECKLRLDEPVDRLLPELAEPRVLRSLESAVTDTVPAKRAITVRDLLTFRFGSGLLMAAPDAYPILAAAREKGVANGPPSPDGAPAPDAWIAGLGSLPLMAQPGEKWLYNAGSDVLGVLIARACGRSFDAFLRERIFEPLGMKDTAFHVPPEKLARLATSYGVDPSSGAVSVYDRPNGQWSHAPKFPSGAGGLCSTVDDYLAFSRMMLAGGALGKTRIVSRASIELMTSDHLTPEQKAVSGLTPDQFANHGWGFGVGVTTRRTEIYENVGTYGWDGGMGTGWRVDPQEEMFTILLTQRNWTSPTPPPLFRDFWTSAYQAIDD
jgi:CubicO group peptidase (beta-lactamase class C family)